MCVLTQLYQMANSSTLAIPSRTKDLLLLLSAVIILYLLLLLLLLHRHPFSTTSSTATDIPTTLHHLLFSVAASSKSLRQRTPYLLHWSRRNSTRTFLFLDQQPISTTADAALPPIIVSSKTSHIPYTFPRGLRSAVRVSRIIKEAVDLNEPDVRWYIFGDDDTVFFTHNLVATLSKYDHNRWYYIGSNSESYEQNEKYSFDMAFGGGGFALSSSLARALSRVLDSCLMRYPHLYGSDARVFSCLSELGVGLTREAGFHQIDVRGDLFGMLSAHPLSPLVSLHHLDVVDPIFPSMNRTQAVEHLFKAVNMDPARIFQQTVCYDSSDSLTVSIAWGYAVQIFEGNQLLPDLLSLQRTFRPWKRGKNVLANHVMFNTREYPSDLCKRPVVFFLDGVIDDSRRVWTNYAKHLPGNCTRSKVIQQLEQISVLSYKQNLDAGQVEAPRRQCCDILPSLGKLMEINIRKCRVDELISMRT